MDRLKYASFFLLIMISIEIPFLHISASQSSTPDYLEIDPNSPKFYALTMGEQNFDERLCVVEFIQAREGPVELLADLHLRLRQGQIPYIPQVIPYVDNGKTTGVFVVWISKTDMRPPPRNKD